MAPTDRTSDEAAFNARLDRVATALLASVTVTSAMLALLGVNGERMWLLLDDNSAKRSLFYAGWFVLAAILCGFGGYLIRSNRLEAVVLALGATFFLISLSLILRAATDAADVGGRASIVDLGVTRESDVVNVSYEVEGSSIDDDERLGVQLIDVSSGAVIAESYPRATAGHVAMKVAVPVPADTSELRLQVWRLEPGRATTPDCFGPPEFDGTSDCVWVSW